MLTYTMDVEDRSRWIISTPSAAELAQCARITQADKKQSVIAAMIQTSSARSSERRLLFSMTL